MTTELPTAAEALAEAVDIARGLTLGLTAAERGHLWLAIANEIRLANDARAERDMWYLRRSKTDEQTDELVASVMRNVRDGVKIAPEPEVPEPRQPVPANLDERMRVLGRPADLRFGGVVPPAPFWSLGDKADCLHCHTPITYVERRMVDPMTTDEADKQYLWVHKYTDQRVCAMPTTGTTVVDMDATAVHTFATPVR